VSAFLTLHKLTGDVRQRQAAVRAGDFLCDKVWDRQLGIFPFEWSGDEAVPEHRAYFFDCGIIARGLVRLYRETGEAKYLEMAEQCADGMLRDFVNDRDIDPILMLPGKEPAARDARWSRSPGCYQLKSALAWLEVGETLGERRYVKAYEDALDAAMAFEKGFLTLEGPTDRVMDRLHAYCYYLEGLLPRASAAEIGRALAAGIGSAESHLRATREGFERSDVCAQLLRVRLAAAQLGVAELDEEAAGQEAARAAGFQMAAHDRRVNGAFCFGRRGADLLPFANPVSSAFCLQALAQWNGRNMGERLDWRDLI
jgi:hypothetical protein